MKFAEFVCFEAIVPQLKASDRDGAIKELLAALDKAGKLPNAGSDQIARAVIKRENEASTGMGKGIAIPHVKHKVLKNVIATVGRCTAGIDFSALDKQPVYSVILLISPAQDPQKHLQAMETVFKYIQQDKFRSFLRQSQTAEQIKELLLEADERRSF